MNATEYLRNKILGVTLLGSAYTAVQTAYLGLATAASTDGSTFTEVSQAEYVRKPLPLTAPVAGSTVISTTVAWTAATTLWGTITHVGIFDAATTSANLLYYSPLYSPILVDNGVPIVFEAGNLVVAVTSGNN